MSKKKKYLIEILIGIVIILICVTIFEIATTVPSPIYDELRNKENTTPDVEISSKYFIGFDYSAYELNRNSPIVICKVRYDKKLDCDYGYYGDNGQVDCHRTFDLTEAQYTCITDGINLRTLYELDPKISDHNKVKDGGSVWLFMYGPDDEELKKIGGFCPTDEEFNRIRRLLFASLPDEFYEFYENYRYTIVD